MHTSPDRAIPTDRDTSEPAAVEPTGHAAESARDQSGRFPRIARRITSASGSALAALVVSAIGAAWAVAGRATDFPRWWELVATIGLPFVTLLMVVLLQHTQNHHALATQLKLDELIRSNLNASNRMMTLESASPTDLDRIHESFEREANT